MHTWLVTFEHRYDYGTGVTDPEQRTTVVVTLKFSVAEAEKRFYDERAVGGDKVKIKKIEYLAETKSVSSLKSLEGGHMNEKPKTLGEFAAQHAAKQAATQPTESEAPQAIMRCKMRVNTVKHNLNSDGTTEQEEVELQAVYGKEGSENAQWSKWTPSASFKILINNPAAFNQLSKGYEFFVDFIPVGTP